HSLLCEYCSQATVLSVHTSTRRDERDEDGVGSIVHAFPPKKRDEERETARREDANLHIDRWRRLISRRWFIRETSHFHELA
ncbi:hypothetical protein PFISCL1PPCAC_3543, partial [Pristionchus fissidentatus]